MNPAEKTKKNKNKSLKILRIVIRAAETLTQNEEKDIK